ncbi:MAG: phosphoglucosamine mutase [archaeon]
MAELFGTDGVRGEVNRYPLTPEMMVKLGKAAATVFRNNKEKHRILIGKDTRISGYIIETALTAGICSMGVDILLVGPLPTPAVAFLAKDLEADAAIMITASHNPAQDNGIKFFSHEGLKLPDKKEEAIEKLTLSEDFDFIPYNELGKARRIDDARRRYIDFAKATVKNDLKGIKLVVDCANGAAYAVAPAIFSELGAETTVINDKPDGLNINLGCGALHPEVVAAAVKESKADIGIAVDGDADRLVVVDENGEILDGDETVAIIAVHMKNEGSLKKDTVVTTIMSNLGFEQAMKKNNIKLVRTNVGDRYVVEEMNLHGYNLGGEQSGHMILFDHNTTGDGIISALQVLEIMKNTGKKLSELKRCMTKLPQVLENIKVKAKPPLESLEKVTQTIKEVEDELGGRGRVLVRYSGTENKCRVMIEGEDFTIIKAQCRKIIDALREEIGA